MVRLLDVQALSELVGRHGLENTISSMITRLERDFSNWNTFEQIPRPAFHVPDGVLELMPVCDDKRFAYKCVNGHPNNPLTGKQTVVATGQMNNVEDGYPVLMTEMTLITALRTAAVSALASDKLARKDAKTIALIGTGAQSEYQAIAHKMVRDIQEIRFFDTDAKAMAKFHKNMSSNRAGAVTKLTPCRDVQHAMDGADIVIVCTACKGRVQVIKDEWVTAGQHINGLGGDCPGKTELDADILKRAHVTVEYFDQSFVEGEIQFFDESQARQIVDAHMFEVVADANKGRTSDEQITVFDGVGIAMEDFSALNVIYDLAEQYDIGVPVDMVPNMNDPKDLFGVLAS